MSNKFAYATPEVYAALKKLAKKKTPDAIVSGVNIFLDAEIPALLNADFVMVDLTKIESCLSKKRRQTLSDP